MLFSSIKCKRIVRTMVLAVISSWLFFFLASYPSKVSAASCGAVKPDHAPDLFQINTTKNSATLYFTPVNNAVTNYTIIYGLQKGEARYWVSFPFGVYDGVIDYKINHLAPNTKYYFRVRADNGCRNGYWSDTLSAKTDWNFKTYTRVK